ncbi:MAG: hypothetical protein WBF81_00495 [Thermoplasmata archaeon]
MAKYSDRGVLSVSRSNLWNFLELHTREDMLPRIHPDVVHQRIVRQSPGEVVVERGIRFRGKVRPNTWKLTSGPPDWSRWEILEAPEGPMTKGSWVANRYSEVPGGTLVVTEGEVSVVGFPRFLQGRLAKTALNRIDAQDREYLRHHP